ncbi:uncharacterized protein [Venturia canescens]|nr:uncharacterized protein LOC122405956 isoform X1 [Venturia canescens]XP_043267990.1 uncharacterized protein LOC122406547 isoform X1 [Venturia canescens]XP_043269718.1 uncharacterized protein LOC122407512 isoform X1 [Venturia canescens]XP_043281903.1 uncharacterized protein LOC122414571 isoform X1 [Venturia canescens]XP_043283326.1 uncharacterized protein LOC122415336 isoform X1 [Venturia canescens]XP_043283334.1 uncharacterized protein LOC122415336 isoform X1 [Venturia canescens]XP_04328368
MDNVFKLVEFREENDGQKKSVDVIPSSWIAYDKNTDGLMAKFMPPPYDEENSALLHSLIECCAPAPEDWPAYAVTVRGRARTYQEGLKKLRILDQKDHAFSTDDEYSSSDKARMAMESYKTGERVSNSLWEVPELTDENLNLISETFELATSETVSKTKEKESTKKIKVVQNKIIPESFTSTQIRHESTPPLMLFNDMVSVINDCNLLKVSETLEPAAASETVSKRKEKESTKKIKVVQNKIIPESFTKTQTRQESTPPLMLFDDMVSVMKDGASLEDIKAAVTKGFYAQSLHLAQISTQLEELKIMCTETVANKMSELPNFSSPTKKHNLILPLKNMQDFMDFEAKLLADEKFRNDIIASMWRIASISVPMQQTVRDIFKKFISRDIVVQFTAVKNTGRKQVLSKTKFFSCVQDVVIAKFASDEKKSVSVKDFEQAVGRVINNAKDWDGNRAIRQKNSQ